MIVGSIPTLENALFSFHRIGNMAQRNIEFLHSTRNLENCAVQNERSVLTLDSHCLPSTVDVAGYSVKL